MRSARKRQGSFFPRRLTVERLESRALLSVSSGFSGIDVTQSSTNVDPPDPVGAAGPNSFVQAVNEAVALFDKTTGTPLPGTAIKSFADFFGQAGTGLDTTGVFFTDPVVVYNDVTDVFGIGVLDFHTNQSGFATDFRFDFAMSTTSDPRTLTPADWDFFRYDVNDDPYGGVNFADFPKIGFNAEGYVVSFNVDNATADPEPEPSALFMGILCLFAPFREN
jgi:hypothetical protein